MIVDCRMIDRVQRSRIEVLLQSPCCELLGTDVYGSACPKVRLTALNSVKQNSATAYATERLIAALAKALRQTFVSSEDVAGTLH